MVQGYFSLEGMSFHAFHGEMEVERELGQVFIVDVECEYEVDSLVIEPTTAGTALGAQIYECTKEAVMGTKYRSIDGLGLHIARKIFEVCSKIDSVTIAISRKQLFIPGDVNSATVGITVTRDALIGQLNVK